MNAQSTSTIVKRETKGIINRLKYCSGHMLFTVVTDGRSSNELMRDVRRAGYDISFSAEDIMRHRDFVISREGEVLSVSIVFDWQVGGSITTQRITDISNRFGYKSLPPDITPYLREMFDEALLSDLGIMQLVGMHKPIPDMNGDTGVLVVNRYRGAYGLDTDHGFLRKTWPPKSAFAFLSVDE